MPFLTIDVGGTDLVVEVNRQGASWDRDKSGIDITPAYSGKPLVTQTYNERDAWPFQTGPLTIDELEALRAAAQYPKAIDVQGDFARTSAAGLAPVRSVRVDVGRAEYVGVGDGDEFLYTASLTITQAD